MESSAQQGAPLPPHRIWRPFVDQIDSVFQAIDSDYDRIAQNYGFECRGCEDNCCRSLFYHYTWCERLYLIIGLEKQPPAEARIITEKARRVVQRDALIHQGHELPRQFCPANRDGRCALYDHRPMICRLHGLPHVLRPPGRPVVPGAGCGWFDQHHDPKSADPLDRTPFYQQMAALEQSLRRALGQDYAPKFKMTVAQMIVAAAREDA